MLWNKLKLAVGVGHRGPYSRVWIYDFATEQVEEEPPNVFSYGVIAGKSFNKIPYGTVFKLSIPIFIFFEISTEKFDLLLLFFVFVKLKCVERKVWVWMK